MFFQKTCHIAQHVVAMTGVDKSSEAKDHKDRMPEKIKFYPLEWREVTSKKIVKWVITKWVVE